MNHEASPATNTTREGDAHEDRIPTAAMLASHMPLVHKVVAHFVRRLPSSVQREDLVAAGTLGLFYALRASTHTCEEMFASYARIRIRGAIVDELRRHDWSPRRRRSERTPAPIGPANDVVPPSGPVGATAAVRPAASDVATTDEVKAPVVVRLMPAPEPPPAAPPRFAVVGFDDLPPQQMQLALGELDGESSGSPLAEVEDKRACEALHAAVDLLPARERAIIRMRYFDAMPSKAIASALGLSEARISQLHARATARLRNLLEEGGANVGLAA